MRSKIMLGMAVLLVSTSAASARPGWNDPRNRLGSRNDSRSPNAVASSSAIMNSCGSMCDFGANLRRREKREYPGAIVRH